MLFFLFCFLHILCILLSICPGIYFFIAFCCCFGVNDCYFLPAKFISDFISLLLSLLFYFTFYFFVLFSFRFFTFHVFYFSFLVFFFVYFSFDFLPREREISYFDFPLPLILVFAFFSYASNFVLYAYVSFFIPYLNLGSPCLYVYLLSFLSAFPLSLFRYVFFTLFSFSIYLSIYF